MKLSDSLPPHYTIRVLGLVSLLSDFASKMVYPVTPLFLTGVLGAPAWTVGVVEGIAESTASVLKLYSGWWSDRVGQRKPFAVMGYGLGALSKLVLAISVVWGMCSVPDWSIALARDSARPPAMP